MTPDGQGMNRRTALKTMAAGAAASAWTAPSAAGQEAQRPPNVVIFHCHDLGQYLHCYGVPTVQTPNLDALAGDGVRFARSFCTAPQCSPSRASLFTGRYPHSTGVMGLTHANFAWDMNPGERHLASYLKEAGYQTAGVGIIHETRSKPADIGIETYRGGARAQQAVDHAIDLVAGFEAERPFYLQVGTIEPHRLREDEPKPYMGFDAPYITPDDELGVHVPPWLEDTDGTRAELAELQGAIRHVDEQVGRLLTALREQGHEANTLFIFTTDHGIAMPRAKCSVYDPGLEVALILRLPSRDGWHGGRTMSELIHNIDYVPSILNVVGIEVPESLQGMSFAPLLDGGAYTPRDAIFCEITYHDYYDPRRCIRTDTHKLIVNFTTAPFFMDPSQSWRPRSDTVVPPNNALAYHAHIELYDLERDPWELTNVAEEGDYAEIRQALLGRLRGHLHSTADPILKGAVTPPHHREALRLLGADV